MKPINVISTLQKQDRLTKKEQETLKKLAQLPEEYQRRFTIWLSAALAARQRDYSRFAIAA